MFFTVKNGVQISQSNGPLSFENGMNENCVKSEEWTRNGTTYRLEVFDYNVWQDRFPHIERTVCYCWAAYRLTMNKWGDLRWTKIPCFTRSEQNAFPRSVALRGGRMVDEYREPAKIDKQLELAI